MPVNKAARVRFDILDSCLRNTKKKWTKADLLYYVNRHLVSSFDHYAAISASQLRYDLEHMQYEYDAPIEMYKEGRKCYYRYTDSEFSIRMIPVTKEDAERLNEAIFFLRQIKGFSFANEIAAVVDRLEGIYSIEDDIASKLIVSETMSSIEDTEFLEDIYHAINRKNVLRMSYRELGHDTLITTTVYPYMLREHDKKWYLLAYCQEKQDTHIYDLDALEEVKVVNHPFVDVERARVQSYFDERIGVSTFPGHDKLQEIVLRCSARQAPFIKLRPLHSSQQLLECLEDGSARLSLKLCPNQELINRLLKFGKDIIVESPAFLAQEILNTARQMVASYMEQAV